MSTMRPGHIVKLVDAQRAFDVCYRSGDIGGMEQAAAILGGLFRNASQEERRAYESQLDECGHVR